MRSDGLHFVNMEHGTLVSEVLPEEVANDIVKQWKENEYGDLLDFGGGTYDITCYDLIELCENKYTVFRKKFTGFTVAAAKGILEECNKAKSADG